jgi:hypothetical protein
MWPDKKQRLDKRKQKLGEKITSDWTWRKFSTKQLAHLNPMIDFNNVECVYQIGWCNGQDEYFDLLVKYISNNEMNKIQELNKTIETEWDNLGEIPVGDYLKTFIWRMKDGKAFIQVIKGTFDEKVEEIRLQQNVLWVDIKSIDNRKLIYPID